MSTARHGDRPVLMCVDDDEQLLETLEFLIGKHFPTYQVVACIGGGDALEQAKELEAQGHEVQLVLSDQVMDGMTGIELLQALPDIFPHAVRIILTGQAGLRSAIDAIKSGIDDYLEKPLSEMDLVKTLRTHLNNFLLREENRRLQEFVRQSRRRTSEITDLAFSRFNHHLTRLLSGQGVRQEVIVELRRSRDQISLLSYLYRVDQAIEGGGVTELFPGPFVQDVAAHLEASPGRRLIDLTDKQVELIDYEEGEAIFGNRAALRIVLERLLENACKYGPAGSTIRITIRGKRYLRTRSQPEANLPQSMLALLPRGCVIVSIEDEGTPSEADIAQLSALIGAEGTEFGEVAPVGLGLIIAQEYAFLIGGRLSFDARAGQKGTILHAAFPGDMRGQTQAVGE